MCVTLHSALTSGTALCSMSVPSTIFRDHPSLKMGFVSLIFELHMQSYKQGSDFSWAGQVGLLTPLTFARHRLSPLAAFTSCAYFLHSGRQ